MAGLDVQFFKCPEEEDFGQKLVFIRDMVEKLIIIFSFDIRYVSEQLLVIEVHVQGLNIREMSILQLTFTSLTLLTLQDLYGRLILLYCLMVNYINKIIYFFCCYKLSFWRFSISSILPK